MSRKKKEPAISREQMLRSVVLPNPNIGVEKNEGGLVRLSVPTPPSPLVRWFPKLAEKSSAVRKIELDEVGTMVWNMCGGNTSVADMIRQLCETYKLNPKESEVSLTAFLRTLVGKNIVGMAVPMQDADNSSPDKKISP